MFQLSILDVLLAVVVFELGSLQSSVPQHSPYISYPYPYPYPVLHMALVLHEYTPAMIKHASKFEPQTVGLAFSFEVPT